MTDDEVIPDDGIVRTALQLLPVPPHADGFWTALGSALDAEEPIGSPALVTVPSPAPETRDLAVVPVAFRRPANAILLAVAAAAAVVVAIAGTSLLDDEDGGGVASPPADVSITDEPGPDVATPVTVSADDEAAATDAVLAWVGQVHEGESTEAWEALGPTSQQHYGSEVAFAEQMTTLAATYAPWSSSPEQVLITAVPGGDPSLAVVTLVGTVTIDGAVQTRADAFPVRLGDDDVQIEPAAGSSLEVVAPAVSGDPALPASLDDDEEVVIVVPDGASAPVLRIDDGAPVVCGQSEDTVLTVLEDAPGRRCGYQPAAGIPAGDHTLTVAYRGADDGAIAARSVVFEAA